MIKIYDKLHFALCDPFAEKELWTQEYGSLGNYALKIFVNGKELNVLLVALEDKEDRVKKPTKPAAMYGHNGLAYMLHMLQSDYAATEGVPLNCCSSCGFEGCWEVNAKVSIGEEEVIWHDFEHSHRPYTYSGLTFHFKRKDYDTQIKRLENWVKKYGH